MSAATSPSSPAANARSPFLVAADLIDPPVDRYATDPVGWTRDILGAHLWSKQREIAESVRDHPRTAVRSGHGIGKTFDAAVVALWFLDCFFPSRVITTATKWSQVEHLLWHEIGQLHARGRRRPEAQGRPVFVSEPLKTKLELPDGRYALGVSSKPENSESFAGHHAPHILVIYDEASGIHSAIFEVGEGYMTTGGARALLIGNPTRTNGEFFDAFHSKRGDYNTIHVSALDSPAITGEAVPEELSASLTGAEWVRSRRKAWGEDSPLYQVRVLGNFPKAGEDTIIPLGLVEDAQARELDADPATHRVTVACDVARFGSDETVIGRRTGSQIRVVDAYPGPQTVTETAAKVLAEAKTHPPAHVHIVIDDDGVGGGVTDIVREDDWVLAHGVPVTAFNAGARAFEPDHYPNRKSELWFAMAERLPELDLDPDDQLAADLTAPKYRFAGSGQRRVESKDETKKRLGRSPDRGDMAVMTLVEPAGRTPVVAAPAGRAAAVPAELVPDERDWSNERF